MDGVECYQCRPAVRGQGTIITMTSEEDKYCTRMDCRILEEREGGSLKKKKEEEEDGGGD